MKRASVLGLAIGATAALALGIGAAIWVTSRPASASDVVLSYFAALASGDAERALAETDSDAPAEQIAAAYASAQDRPADARIVSATNDADSARVVVTYTLAEETREVTMRLSHTDAWRIEDAVGEVIPTSTIGDSVGLGALILPTDSAVALLPGRYDLNALPRELVIGTATIDVAPGLEAEVALEATVAAEATAAAQTQLDIYIDQCTAPAAEVPENCGIRVPWAADLTSLASVEFRIDERPVLALAPDGASFAATGGVLVATATGAARDGGTGSFTYRADDWALRGTVSFQGNEMVLAVG